MPGNVSAKQQPVSAKKIVKTNEEYAREQDASLRGNGIMEIAEQLLADEHVHERYKSQMADLNSNGIGPGFGGIQKIPTFFQEALDKRAKELVDTLDNKNGSKKLDKATKEKMVAQLKAYYKRSDNYERRGQPIETIAQKKERYIREQDSYIRKHGAEDIAKQLLADEHVHERYKSQMADLNSDGIGPGFGSIRRIPTFFQEALDKRARELVDTLPEQDKDFETDQAVKRELIWQLKSYYQRDDNYEKRGKSIEKAADANKTSQATHNTGIILADGTYDQSNFTGPTGLPTVRNALNTMSGKSGGSTQSA